MARLVKGKRLLQKKDRLNLSIRERAVVKAFLERRRDSALKSMQSIADSCGISPQEWDIEMVRYYRWAASILDWLLKTLHTSERVKRGRYPSRSKNEGSDIGR